MKIKVHVLTTGRHLNSFAFVFPILRNRKDLLDRGIKFVYFSSINKNLFDSDLIFIDSKFFRDWWWEEHKVYPILKKMKESSKAVLWFDTTDSTGTPQFKLMPYVDGYYKSQILKDPKVYLRNLYGARIISDYYNSKYNVTDKIISPYVANPINQSYIKKIYLSWNAGLGDHGVFGSSYGLYGSILSRVRIYLPFSFDYTAKFINVNKPRNRDITARVGLTHVRNYVAFHRRQLEERLEKFKVDTRFLKRFLYYKELRNSKLSISPFGLGESTYRDFDTIINGALLIKPDMSHMKTWPDLYKDNETYIGCKWDFSNIKEKIEGLLLNPKKISAIAQKAQDNYSYYLFGGGRTEFCDRVEGIIKKHLKE